MIDFKQEYILENDRVRLRPLMNSDFDILSKFSIEEPNLWEYSLTPASGLENLKKYIDQAIMDRKNGLSYPYIVYDKRVDQYAGSTRFYDYQSNHKTIQLGYTWYGKRFHGTGLNKNCKYLMLALAFDNWNLERIEFRADSNNAKSIAAMKSIGCTVEGILRSNCAGHQGRRDSIVLSILKKEWKEVLKDKLHQKILE